MAYISIDILYNFSENKKYSWNFNICHDIRLIILYGKNTQKNEMLTFNQNKKIT